MTILINFLLTIFVIVALLLILVVLMQRPKSEGLGAAFGGGMTENLFGAQTTNVLANFTRYLGGIFFALALLLSVLYAKHSRAKSAIQQDILKTAKPVAAPATSPAAASSSPSEAPSAATSPVQLAPEAESSPAPKLALPVATPEVSPVMSVTATPKPMPSPSPSGARKATPAPTHAKR